ncbi:MAG: mechanosensitive ion channel family protein, partial [Dehalococcoidales bacterium]
MWDTISTWLLEHGITILVIVVAFYIAYRMVGALINRFISRYVRLRGKGRHSKLWFKNRSQTLSTILTGATGVLMLFIALFMVLSELDIDIGPLLASAGVLGIAIGFGAQSLIKDLLSGLFVLLED